MLASQKGGLWQKLLVFYLKSTLSLSLFNRALIVFRVAMCQLKVLSASVSFAGRGGQMTHRLRVSGTFLLF